MQCCNELALVLESALRGFDIGPRGQQALNSRSKCGVALNAVVEFDFPARLCVVTIGRAGVIAGSGLRVFVSAGLAMALVHRRALSKSFALGVSGHAAEARNDAQ